MMLFVTGRSINYLVLHVHIILSAKKRFCWLYEASDFRPLRITVDLGKFCIHFISFFALVSVHQLKITKKPQWIQVRLFLTITILASMS